MVDEDCIIASNHLRQSYQNKTLRITIMPTQACNFSCWYCYENHHASKMDTDAVDAIFSFIKNETNRKNIRRVVLDWFGGEPLLYFYQVIYPLSKAVKEWAEESGLKFSNMITTNGALITDEMAKLMDAVRLFSFQITLDGNREHGTVFNKL